LKQLHLRVHELVVANFTGKASSERTYPLNIDQTYHEVTDWRQLLVPGFLQSLSVFNDLRQELAHVLPDSLGSAFSSAFKEMGKLGTEIKDGGKKAGDFLKGLFGKDKKPQ
jgi:hypothetical protein